MSQDCLERRLCVDSAMLLGAAPTAALQSSDDIRSPSTGLTGARAIEPTSQNIRFDATGEQGASVSRGIVIGAVLLLATAAAAYWWMVIRPQTGGRVGQSVSAPSTPSTSTASASNNPAAPASSTATDPVASGANTSQNPLAAPSASPSAPEPNPQTSAQLAANAAAALAAQRTPVVAPAITPAPSPAPQAASLATSAAAPSTPPPVAASSTTTQTPAASVGRLQLQFAEDAWVQIRGPRGKVMHEKLHVKGSSFEFDGDGKLALTIGNAKNVKLSQKGKVVDLAPHTEVAVARLTLE
jgi:cytoskeletal protein RodZ